MKMIKDIFKDYISPGIVFAGGMIGVGFLSLPYIASQAGLWVTLFYFIIVTLLASVMHSIFAEISLKTPDFKRFPGFVGHHLGKPAEIFTALGFGIVQVGVLLAYLIVGGEFLTSILQPYLGGTLFLYSVAYFLLGSVVIFFGIKTIAKMETIVLSLLVLGLVGIFFAGVTRMSLQNIFFQPSVTWETITMPYGPLLFSLWGIGFVPVVEEMIPKKKKKNLNKVIFYSTLAVSIFYFLFTLCITGIAGNQTSQVALAGLENFLPGPFVFLALVAGVIITFHAFVAQGNMLKETFMYDMGITNKKAFIISVVTPMILLLAGLTSFVQLVSFIGGVLLGIFGIMIVLMYAKIKGKPIIIYPLLLVFILGIIGEVISIIK